MQLTYLLQLIYQAWAENSVLLKVPIWHDTQHDTAQL